MRVKYSKLERTAGLFVLIALIGGLSALIGTAVKKGWFRVKIPYYTLLENSEGVRPGTPVELAGVRIGSVDSIDFTETMRIKVRLLIFQRFQNRIRKDSIIQLIRPYVIGDKVMYLTLGTPGSDVMPQGSTIRSEEVVGLTDILNGRKLIPYVQTIGRAFKEIKNIVDTMLTKKGSKEFAKVFVEVGPLLSQLGRFAGRMADLTEQLTAGGDAKRMVRNLASFSAGVNNLLPEKEATEKMGAEMGELVSNLRVITQEFKLLLPAISEVAPDLPRTSRRLVEAIDEAVIVLKALQRSFLLRGSAREIKREEAREKGEPTPRDRREKKTPSFPGSQ